MAGSRHVSYSELSTYRQCPHKHQLSYIDRWTKDEAAPALTRGRLFHELLAEHYTALKEGRPDRVEAFLGSVYEKDPELADLLTWMWDGYREMYGADSGWKILAVERTSMVPLRTEAGARSSYRLKMILDLLVQDPSERIWLVDHKSNADFPNELGLELDDQFSLYNWGLREEGINVHGVIYNCCRTRRNKSFMPLETRFKRFPMYRPDVMLNNTALDAYRTCRRMRSAKYAERTTNSDTCLWRCSYTEACLHGRKGGDEVDHLVSSGFVVRRR